MNAFKNFLQTIYDTYDDLTGREKVLADSLIENPSLIVLHTASQLAKNAGVSNSTVTRLVQRLGFENFDQVREEARTQLSGGSPLAMLNTQQSAPATPDDEIHLFLEKEVSLIRSTFSTLNPMEIDAITKALVKARTISFLGFRNSHFFAAYAHWQFIQFHHDVRLIGREGETLAEKIAHLGPHDVVVMVGVRRLVKNFEHNLKTIAQTGAKILLLTDPSSQKMSSHATWTLICPVDNSNGLDSYAGVLSLIRLLAYKALVKSGSEGENIIRRVEEYHEKLGEFE